MKKKLQSRFRSRQYMLSKDYEIYYYKDHDLSKVDSHAHNYYEFYFFLEGDVSMEIAGTVYPLQQGDVVLIPPGIFHHAVIHSTEIPYRRFVFWITEEYLSHMMEDSAVYGYLMQYVRTRGEYIFHNDRICFNGIQMKVFRLIEETKGERYGREAQISLCIRDLILHLNRLIYEKKHAKTCQEEQELYSALMEYIEDHLDEELSLEALAAEFFVSKYYIAHTFKDHIGIPIHQYIMKKRLDAVREALRSGQQAGGACMQYGFKDYSVFYKAFKKEYGMSPSQWKDAVKFEKNLEITEA